MEPIKALFRSRKFLVALFAVIQAIVFEYADVSDALWQAIALLAGVLIASIAYEDGREKGASPLSTPPAPHQPPVQVWLTEPTSTTTLYQGGAARPVTEGEEG